MTQPPDFTAVLETATQQVSEHYFQLRIDGGEPVYRERVYCYELYHQMRIAWPNNSHFLLHAEVDKSGHPVLSESGVQSAKPDFLVHIPGDMKGNHTIIEVKSSTARRDAIKKDLTKLTAFLRKDNYRRAIYLIYGNESKETGKGIIENLNEPKISEHIEIWIHSEVRKPAQCIHPAP